jgi:UDP-sulfoquinovose synthase
MRILVLGGDGYLGWPTAMYLSRRGHSVAVMDNFSKRSWERELGVEPLFSIRTLPERIDRWRLVTGKDIELFVGDLQDYPAVEAALELFRPDAIVHYGQQPSAPYSMMDREHSVFTQVNNLVSTLNVLWAIKKINPACHFVKLGTMGEYGTPNIDIEEGFIEIEHKGRKDLLPFPCQPASFYHLSKVHDSHNIRLACKIWKLAATDLNQGVVYGITTDETSLHEALETSFHYDEVFGTALNRFCVQAVADIPLTVYGQGGQKRGFLNIRDTLQCVELAILNPAQPGEYRVFNQFTEIFTVAELAHLVADQSRKLGFTIQVQHAENPRVEAEEHYYNPTHTKLRDLGLQPHRLSDVLIKDMLRRIRGAKGRIKHETIQPRVRWDGGRQEAPQDTVAQSRA